MSDDFEKIKGAKCYSIDGADPLKNINYRSREILVALS